MLDVGATVVASGAGARALDVLIVAGYVVGIGLAAVAVGVVGFLILAALSEDGIQVALLVACPVLGIAGYIVGLTQLYVAAAACFGLAALGAVLDL